mmetsp:Transcript_7585/g.18294  ORF Transcript_7585/g.18294 Transcript_7585/m.18294 type:complete len:88 (+) Transcript_7585:133-396(+)
MSTSTEQAIERSLGPLSQRVQKGDSQNIICTMQPLRRCIEDHLGDLRKCKEEIKLFESTCDRRLKYVHDREGLDDVDVSIWTGVERM